MHAVLSLPTFTRQAQREGLDENEVLAIEAFLAANPQAGDVIRGTGGLRKVRFPGRGKGKSGGYRTVHFYAGDDVPVFLLGIYGKGRKADLTPAERKEAARLTAVLADAYRAGVSAKVMELDTTRKGSKR